MRIEQLEYLIAVSKSPSINLASEKLHISHQCLNKAIKSLEEELGTPLLNRTTKGISLTEDGKKALETAIEVLAHVDELKSHINQQKRQKQASTLKGSLSIVAAPLQATVLLPSIVNTFKKQHPKVNISVLEVSPHEVLEQIDTERYDFGITNMVQAYIVNPDTYPKLDYDLIHKEKIFALVSIHSALSNNKSISLRILLKYPLLIYGPPASQGNYSSHVLAQYGPINNCSYTNNLNIYADSIASGTYYSINTLSGYFNLDPSIKAQLITIPLKDGIESYWYLVVQKNKPLSTIAAAAINLIKSKPYPTLY